MQVTGRFSPHPRGFGFVDLDAPATVTGPTGRTQQVDSLFVPPDLARGWVADDVVRAEVEVDDQDRVNAASLAFVARPRRFLVGKVGQFVGRMVLELDPKIGVGQVEVSDGVSQKVLRSIGHQVVVTVQTAEDGTPSAGAVVHGPVPAMGPAALRARAVVLAHGAASPDLVPGGPQAVGLDPVEANGFSLRATGRIAGGGAGLAAGLDGTSGRIPGAELEYDNLRHELAVTIDSDSSKDLDDALVAGWTGEAADPVHLTVHIADVGAMVPIDSEADRYARTMATSAYFVSGDNAPMLDPVLSEDQLSLLPHEPRRVLSVTMQVLPDGTFDEVHLHASWIDSHARLSYAAVDAYLADGSPDHLLLDAHGPNGATPELLEPTHATVAALTEASRRLGTERDSRETLESLFEDATLEATVVDGKIRAVDADPHPAAQRLVERLMVAANEAVAGWAEERGIPLLYRSHVGFDPDRVGRLRAALAAIDEELPVAEGATAPELGDLMRLVERLRGEGRLGDAATIATVATGVLARATYEPDPSRHGALGSGYYCHFTSPIRRYADLVVHRQLRAALAGEELPYDVEQLRALAGWLDKRAGSADHAQALERNSLWAILLQRGAVLWPAEAVITGLSPAGLRVRLPEAGIAGFVSAQRVKGVGPRDKARLDLDEHELEVLGGKFRIGQRIKVRLDRVDDTGRAEFDLA